MSKGLAPRKDKRLPDVTVRRPKPASGAPAGELLGEEVEWTFIVVDPTTLAREARVGAAVFGTVSSRRILVESASGPLGFAPSDVGKQMLRALAKTEGKLRGEVVAIGPLAVTLRIAR